MGTSKRLTAFLICIVLLAASLISCVNQDQGGNTDLQTDKYIASVRIKYATNDAKMKAAVDALNATASTLKVDGDDVSIVTSASVNGISNTNEYTYVGGVLYQAKSLAVSDKTITVKERAAMTADQRSSLISKAGPGAGIGIGDFLDIEMNTYNNSDEYVCSNMLDESKESLRKIIAKSFEGVGTVAIEDASYRLEMKGERNISSVLSCDLVINMDGVDYKVTMHLYYEYDYDAEFSILSPENADSYTEVSVDGIIG